MALENDIPADIAPDTTAAPDTAQAAPVQQAPADEPYDPADFYADDKPGEQETESEGGAPESDGQEETPELEPITPPLSWPDEDKAKFAALPRETQELVARRETERDTFLRRKSQEYDINRKAFEAEAVNQLQTVLSNYQQQLQQYAQMVEAPQPDLRLLNSDDPAHRTLYFQQEAAYRNSVAQRGELAQHMQDAQRQSELIAEQQRQADLQAEHSLLEEKLSTEWSDPSSRAKLLGNLTPIAAELGYSQDLIAQARACDILAMKTASNWKVKADKWDEYNKAKMIPVRNGKTNQIPPTSRPNAPNGSRAPVSIEAQMYPDDVRRN